MQTPLTEYRKNIVSISQFGGLNHTDLAQPGEWYEMKNISGRYSPILTPRRSRAELVKIFGHSESVIHKNGYFIYSNDEGEIRHQKGQEIVLLHSAAGKKPYRFLEMGNKVLCLNDTVSDVGQITFENTICFTKYLEYEVRQTINYDHEQYEAAYYYAVTNQAGTAYTCYTKKANRENIFEPETVNADSMSMYADRLLNVCFRYVVEQDNGKDYVLDIREEKTAEQIAAMTTTQYYIAQTDHRLYKHDGPSGANIEIIAPKIAVFIRNPYDIYPPEQIPAPMKPGEGDYISLEIGHSINLTHPFAWTGSAGNYTHKTSRACKYQLRVARYYEYDDTDTAGWFKNYGWQYFYIFDYNAQFEEWLRTNNLFIASEPYTQPFISGAAYPTITFKNDDPSQGPITATTINIPPSGTKKFYPAYIKISNAFPAIDCTLQHNNRIWGANNVNNEIKASAQGNWKNWDDYRELVSDSYAVTVGSDGAFSASCVIDDYLFFFKENSYTLLYGTRPSNFCTNTVEDFIGIRTEDAESLQVIGKSAYYMGADGKVYRFNGSDSVCISLAFGDERYTVLGSAHSQDKYYLHLQKGDEKLLFVYHTTTGMWFIEDADDLDKVQNIRNQAVAFLPLSGETKQTEILLLDKWEIPKVECNTVKWWCESGLFGLESDYYRYISNLKITFESEVGATVEVFAKFDSDDAYTPLAKYISQKQGTRTEKINIKRCEFMRLKIQGTGFSKIYRISYLTQQGSEK
ncbi:MAG: hypothetical protein IJG23_02250 [Clostridia bacterium]|nr:hypothetical protein [Clostridia bacterium]